MPQAIQYADLVVPIRTKPQPRAANKFVPVCFSRMPDEALSGLPLYMRSIDASGAEKFTLYAAAGVKFTPAQRQRLEELGISFIHIHSEDQPRLRRQLEERIESLADDRAIELAVRCEIIYESGLELIDETLTSRELKTAVPRLKRVARSIVRLYEENPKAFAHFFAAARHDACSSTHAINAAVWLPALALALGEEFGVTQAPALVTLCLGAMLYDAGMAFVPPVLYHHNRKLNAGERRQVQQHPEMGAQMLRQIPDLPPVVAIMALQHHERLDGSGYPRRLTFDQIHKAARIAAVLDTFDAATSFRPYRKQGLSPAAAVAVLKKESPRAYDPRVVECWTKLLRDSFPELFEESADAADAAGGDARRRFRRFATNCPAQLRMLLLNSGIWTEQATVKAVAHNLSRGGMGLLSRTPLNAGDYFRAKLLTKGGVAKTLTGVVVRVRRRDDGLFEAGARFVDLAQEAAPLPQGQFVAPESTPPSEAAPVAGDCLPPNQL